MTCQEAFVPSSAKGIATHKPLSDNTEETFYPIFSATYVASSLLAV